MASTKAQEVLKQYWGHDQFRTLQEDIINSIIEGKDTLALLPTGGGKSICFQVPGMLLEGICIVVSPLIALMKDQVNNLNKRGIKASAIYSGLSHHENKNTLNNCIHGDIKFLYLSPERLKSDFVREHLKQMQVSLLAIDEAHCISQWGYDFRPEYLQIKEVRTFFPKVPVIALTASATKEVIDDIQDQLGFANKHVFTKSFERKNLAYVVNSTEDKMNKLVHILSRVKGSALIYVRNRRKTQEIAHYLNSKGISSDYYHAGLPYQTRMHKQEMWIRNRTRLMVCTNAFGMGIDKPDVRLVIHYEMSDSLESYYQESGRAGRDELKSYAVLLYGKPDEFEAHERLKRNFPDKAEIVKVYNALCSHYSLATGSYTDRSFDFDIAAFEQKYHIAPAILYPVLKSLETCDLVLLNDAFHEPSKVKIILHYDQLYKFQVEHPTFDDFLKLLLRSYGGVFDQHMPVQEDILAQRGQTDVSTIHKMLERLHMLQVIDYVPQKDKPQIVFLSHRPSDAELPAKLKPLDALKKKAYEKLEAMIDYAKNDAICRSRKLVSYFDQWQSESCGHCDVCIEQKKVALTTDEFEALVEQIKSLCVTKAIPVKELTGKFRQIPAEKIIEVVRYLLDNDKLRYNEQQHLEWKA